jgi:cellulose synthase/poly-beta-1,6-N-acetylglucosamine synthase-like glycosyltransferase
MSSSNIISTAILLYFLGINLFYFALIVIAFAGIISHQLKAWFATANEIYKARITPPISIIAPAYNEELSIIENIKSLLQLRYKEFEVIVVNDGSTDSTFDKINSKYKLIRLAQKYYPDIPTKQVKGIYRSAVNKKLIVIDKENGGKADSLNAGINVSIYPLFCAMDSDSILEKDALLRLVHPFMENYREVIATGGLIRVINSCRYAEDGTIKASTSKNWLVNTQIVEYCRAFLVGRLGLSKLNCNMIISGAYGLFKKAPVKEIGGYRCDVVGEDMELTIRLMHVLQGMKKASRIHYIPDTVCWTEVPEKFSTLSGQRNRWHRGLIESIFLHITMLFNPRHKTVAFIGMPYFVFIELLNPIFEIAGYTVIIISFITGTLNLTYIYCFFFLTIGLGVLFTSLALIIEELFFHKYSRIKDILRLLAAAFLESFGYHQLLTLVKLKAVFDKIFGIKSWGKMERVGFNRSEYSADR